VPDRSGFATTMIGPPFWGERLGATLATLRLSRQPLTPLARVEIGAAIPSSSSCS
jgi:hypothetical protein